jgi:hypothetical protein
MFFKILLILAYVPVVFVFLLPRSYNSLWWNIFVIISFVSCVLFCAFGNAYLLKAQKHFTSKVKLFNRIIIFYLLGAFLITPVFMLFLIETKNVLSNANTIAIITAIIISFKIFRIDIKGVSE